MEINLDNLTLVELLELTKRCCEKLETIDNGNFESMFEDTIQLVEEIIEEQDQ